MVREGKHSGISDDTRRRAMAFVKDADMPKPAVTANPKLPKQRMVSKKELDESGLSLRDFLNRERGLTRREDKPMSKADAVKQLKLGEKPSKEDVASAKERLGIEDSKKENAPDYMAESAKSRGVRNMYERGAEASAPRLNSEENKDATGETFKRGGKVSSASRRADGIAIRGKTRA